LHIIQQTFEYFKSVFLNFNISKSERFIKFSITNFLGEIHLVYLAQLTQIVVSVFELMKGSVSRDGSGSCWYEEQLKAQRSAGAGI